MSNQIYRINEYKFSNTDVLLFDANIWLYLYGPQGKASPRLKDTYSVAFRQIRGAKSRIFIDILVLSEFINACARFIYNDWPQATKPADFKSFRNSADFKPIAAKIAKNSRRILSKAERTDSGFESLDLGPILSEYAAGESDFNDQILAELCREKGLKLVTHDGDFQGENLTILTANSRYFS